MGLEKVRTKWKSKNKGVKRCYLIFLVKQYTENNISPTEFFSTNRLGHNSRRATFSGEMIQIFKPFHLLSFENKFKSDGIT